MADPEVTSGQIITNADGTKVIDYSNNQFNKYKRSSFNPDVIDGLNNHLDKIDGTLEWKQSRFGNKEKLDKTYRDSKQAWLDDRDVATFMFENMKAANKDPDWNFDITDGERVQYTKYGVGGHYTSHTDAIISLGNPRLTRKLTMVVVLNDDFEGGQFQFVKVGMTNNIVTEELDLRKGESIVFPAMNEHAVLPVTSGERRIVISWAWGPLWK